MDSDKIKIDLSKGLDTNFNEPYSLNDLINKYGEELLNGELSEESIAATVNSVCDNIKSIKHRLVNVFFDIYHSMMILKYVNKHKTFDTGYISTILKKSIFLNNYFEFEQIDHTVILEASNEAYSKVRNMIVPFVDDIEIPESIDDNEEFKFENALNNKFQIENFKKYYSDKLEFYPLINYLWRLL